MLIPPAVDYVSNVMWMCSSSARFACPVSPWYVWCSAQHRLPGRRYRQVDIHCQSLAGIDKVSRPPAH